jgi:hypothetical protein
LENLPARFPAWPGDAEVAVALTFDVDGEAPWLSEGPDYARRLTTLSQGRFGPARGLGRILDLLAEREITATFYVPGHTGWELTPETLDLLGEFGFGYDASLMADDRAVTYTMHPEAIGRGYLVQMLDSMITTMASQGRPWFATHAQIAALAGPPPGRSSDG